MEDQSRAAMHVSWVSILANVLLSLLKLLAGLLAHSGAMVSDAVHSCSDVFSTVVVMIGMRLSARDSDREHPYGHERLECVAAVILAVVLLITGLFIGYGGLQTIIQGQSAELRVPGLAALAAALVSIAVKEGMFWYTRRYARALDSPALMADAWHHRSDAFSSVGALVGIAGARLGLPILDPLASVVICAFIVKAALDIFRDAMDKMVDRSCDEETEAAIRARILAHPDVRNLDRLLTRTFGNRIYIELEIAVDGRLSLVRAHEIAEQLHDDVEAAFPKVKHVMVHVNPSL
ncbi:MAG: cation transporter [Oscillospiraceae bacterium]|nr:cation transporter [Oscillospiraceae bacterium]